MLLFEQSIINLFEREDLNYDFNSTNHVLRSSINIEFIPNCSQPEILDLISNDLPSNTIRIWEDLYLNNKPAINSRLLSLMGVSKRIHARETNILDISQQVLDEFISMNHINIPTKSRYRFGLFLNDRLVAIASFGRSCPIDHEGKKYISHELIRFGNLLNHTVVGGLSKLIRYFEQKHSPEHIMTYVDREWSEGKSFLKLGFKNIGTTPPQVFYFHPDKCERLYRSQITGLSDIDLEKKGWKTISNMGNIKLVKIL